MNETETHPNPQFGLNWAVGVCLVWTVLVFGAVVPAALPFGASEANGAVSIAFILILAFAACLETVFGVLRLRGRGLTKAGMLGVICVCGGLILVCAYGNLTEFPLVFLPVCPVPWCIPPMLMAVFPPIVVTLFGLQLTRR